MSRNKTVFERLDAIQQELDKLNAQGQNLSDQLRGSDPVLTEFIKSAKRVLRYCGEKSQLRKENNRRKVAGIVWIVIAILQFFLSFFLNGDFLWLIILVGVNGVLFIGLEFVEMQPYLYEVEYGKRLPFWRKAEKDDNGIINQISLKWWAVAVICVEVITFFILSICMMSSNPTIGFLMLFCAGIVSRFLSTRTRGFEVHFVDGENDVEYYLLKEYMRRNNLQ